MTDRASPPWWQVALTCRCPRCGEGRLFRGVLTVNERCGVCGLDLREHDAGDGPAVLVIFLLATMVVAAAFWVEFRFSPPLWVHAVLWPVVTVPLALAMMRPLKAALVALQYRHRSSEMGV
ncbi:DUF983 domain-containing protein [Rhodovastum sp. RN2-1]|uniref:DUF983 domain-containing protein n=1 Tax=Limobrevibacterium gyesilva TaxID=2991712 RepID=A0AA42CFU3_9PROT|nr:DUF983 domain-containing protein [Limobrevibacterium gyesilva]